MTLGNIEHFDEQTLLRIAALRIGHNIEQAHVVARPGCDAEQEPRPYAGDGHFRMP